MTIPSRRMGTTRSGKAVCIYLTDCTHEIHEQLKAFDRHDHFDAFAIFQYLAIAALRKHGKSSLPFTEQLEYVKIHRCYLDGTFLKNERKQLVLVTVFDVVQYGKGLTQNIFVD